MGTDLPSVAPPYRIDDLVPVDCQVDRLTDTDVGKRLTGTVHCHELKAVARNLDYVVSPAFNC